MSLKIEDLPSEIWMSIFIYFEGHDLVRSFSGLNFFFDSSLRSSHLQLYMRIRLEEYNERLPDYPWSHINLENIYALSTSRRKANCLIQFLRWHAPSLTHLSYLSVYIRKSNDYYNIQLLIFALSELTSLKRLRVKCRGSWDLSDDYSSILLENIFKTRFSIQQYSLLLGNINGDRKTSTWSVNPMTKSLYISNISMNNLLAVLSNAPQSYSLHVGLRSPYPTSFPNVVYEHLRKIHLNFYDTPFIQLQKLKSLAPNLQSLHLNGYSFRFIDENYFKEDFWSDLLANLKYFHINLKYALYENAIITLGKSYVSTLNDKLWFSYTENSSGLTILIKFQSTTT